MVDNSKCISHFVNDGKPQKQAVAICLNSPKAHQAQKVAQITSHGRLLTAQFSARSLTTQLSFKKKRE